MDAFWGLYICRGLFTQNPSGSYSPDIPKRLTEMLPSMSHEDRVSSVQHAVYSVSAHPTDLKRLSMLLRACKGTRTFYKPDWFYEDFVTSNATWMRSAKTVSLVMYLGMDPNTIRRGPWLADEYIRKVLMVGGLTPHTAEDHAWLETEEYADMRTQFENQVDWETIEKDDGPPSFEDTIVVRPVTY